MTVFRRVPVFAYLFFCAVASAENSPTITLVANAEGENPVIAPNTWVEIKGQNLSKAGDTRAWQSTDFVNGLMPMGLDGVSVTVAVRVRSSSTSAQGRSTS